MMQCSICQGPIEAIGDWTDGNNALPFAGRCCNDCDNRFVTPARMLRVDNELDCWSVVAPILREFARLGRINAATAAQAAALRCQHRDDGRGRCIDCGTFLPTPEDEQWEQRGTSDAEVRHNMARWQRELKR